MPAPFLFSLLLNVGLTVLSAALSPKPKEPRAGTLDDFQAPTAEEGRPLGVLFGTTWLKSPNVVWIGDFKAKPIRRGPKKFGLFGKRAITGYKYKVGIHMMLCHGEIDSIDEIKVDSKPLIDSPINSPGVFTVDKEKLFSGGNGEPDGISGDFYLHTGQPNSGPIPYLQQVITPGEYPNDFLYRESGFRDIAGVVLQQANIGLSPVLRPFEFLTRRQPTFASIGGSSAIGDDMNPAAILYEILTNPVWGFGEPESSIDIPSFSAAFTTLANESFGLSLFWGRETPIEDFIQTVLTHIDAVMYFDRRTGKFTLKLLRGDYLPENLPILDEDNVLDFNDIAQPSFEDIKNSYTLRFPERITGNVGLVSVQNVASFQEIGRVAQESGEFPGIQKRDLASVVASRELEKVSRPFLNGELTVPFEVAKNLYTGDPFVLTSERRSIFGLVCRVLDVSFGDTRKSDARLRFQEDLFADRAAGLVQGVFDAPSTAARAPLAPDFIFAEEAPFGLAAREFGPSEMLSATDSDPDVGFLAAGTGAPLISAISYLSLVNNIEDAAVLEIPYAILGPALRDPSDTNIPIVDSRGLENVTPNSTIIYGNEIMTLNTINGTTSVSVDRGALDTVPQEHATPEIAWFVDEYFEVVGEEFSKNQTVNLKVVSISGGQSLDPNLSPSENVTFRGRMARPLPAANVRLAGSVNGPGTIAAGTTRQLTWSARSRTAESSTNPRGFLNSTSILESGVTFDVVIESSANAGGPYNEVERTNVGTLTTYTVDADLLPGVNNFFRIRVEPLLNGLYSEQDWTIEFERVP